MRLTVGGHSQSQPLTVKMDPRVDTSPADLALLHTAQVRLAATLGQLSTADLAGHSIQEQLAAPENTSLSAQLGPFNALLKTLLSGTAVASASEGPQERPGLDDITAGVAQLYGMLQQSDNPPTQALFKAVSHAEDEAREAAHAWADFQAKQVPLLNQTLRKANRPALNPGKAPDHVPEVGDED